MAVWSSVIAEWASSKQTLSRRPMSCARSMCTPMVMNRQPSPWLMVVSVAPLNRWRSAMASARNIGALASKARSAWRPVARR